MILWLMFGPFRSTDFLWDYGLKLHKMDLTFSPWNVWGYFYAWMTSTSHSPVNIYWLMVRSANSCPAPSSEQEWCLLGGDRHFFLQTCKLIWCQRVKFKSNLSLILGGSFLMSHWEVQTSGGPRQVPCGAGGPGGRGRMSKVLHQFDFKEVFNSVQVLYSKTKFGNKKQFSSKVIKSELTWDLLKYKWSKTNRKVISLCKQLQLYSISLWTNISSSE